MNKVNREYGVVFIAVGWCILFFSAVISFDLGEAFRYIGYYFIFAVGTSFAIAGCIFLFIHSHKTILNKDQKETITSIIYLIVEIASVIVGVVLTEWDILLMLTANISEQMQSVAQLFICSFLFTLTGAWGLCYRRVYINMQTLLSLCIMAIAILDLGKVLSV